MMNMLSWKRLTLVGMLALVLVATIHYAPAPSRNTPAPAPTSISTESESTKPPPDPNLLAERLEMLANFEPSPEEVEEKQQYNRKLAVEFSYSLNDPDPSKRVAAVEQLGAYPSPEAEDSLTQALNNDTDSNIRAIAARTLDTLDNPSPVAIDALIRAMEDYAPEVQHASLVTLEGFLSKQPSKDLRARIVRGLKDKSGSRNLTEETNEYLQELLLRYQSRKK